jgi:site-specific recombinase XerD
MVILSMEFDLSTLITRFIEYLEIERNCSRLTIIKYRHYLEKLNSFFIDDLKIEKPNLSDINLESVRKFRIYLARQPGLHGDLKSVTQGYYVIVLRSFLKWAAKNDFVAMAPDKIEVPRNKEHSLKFLNAEQITRLLNQPLLSTPIGLRDRAILELLFSTGLRVSEMVALNRDQIDLKTREFGIIGKGGHARIVFISHEAATYIDRYLKSRTDKVRPLFINFLKRNSIVYNENKSRLTSRAVQYLVKKYTRQAKLPVDATPHTLRHSMATDLLRAGADLRSVQELLGHANIATTQIYTHITDSRLREVHEKFHSGNKG